MKSIQLIDCNSFTGMQNLSISCALVCLIILGSAALLGAFGVCQRQISAILVTGVMYLLAGKANYSIIQSIEAIWLTIKPTTVSFAALFAVFTLMIIHFKRHQRRPLQDSDFDGTFDGIVAPPGAGRAAQHLLNARQFATSWSLDLGWGGVVFCGITYVLWIMLSKIMRYNPLSALLIWYLQECHIIYIKTLIDWTTQTLCLECANVAIVRFFCAKLSSGLNRHLDCFVE